MNRELMYQFIYGLAASNGREQELFGGCGPAAYEAFVRSLVAKGFPELWFELPLAGEPWLDLHALISYEDVAGTQPAFAGLGGVYADGLAWFASQKPGKVRQLALSYDSSRGEVERPALQLLVNGPDASVPEAFLRAAGRADAVADYHAFVGRMPQEWYACYVGVFPSRDVAGSSPWTRVECIVRDEAQQAYARDVERLRADLAKVGLASGGAEGPDNPLDDEALACIQELARSPFPLEFQFNVGTDGLAQPCLSASVRFQGPDWTDVGQRAEAERLYALAQDWGLADDRWRLLRDTAFAKSATRNGVVTRLVCFPAFIKLRWRAGERPDAKAYLMAWAEEQLGAE